MPSSQQPGDGSVSHDVDDDLRLAVESLPVQALILDQRRMVVGANSAWLEYARSQAPGEPNEATDPRGTHFHPRLLGLGVDPGAIEPVMEGIEAVVDGRSERFRTSFRKQRTGSANTASQLQASAVTRGQERGVLITLLDVVDSQEVLRRCEMLHAALQRTREFILFVAPSGAVTFTNSRTRRAVGYPPDEWSDKSIWELDTNFDESQWWRFFSELRDLGTLSLTTSLVTREGVAFPVEMIATYFELSGQESVFLYGREPGKSDLGSGSFRFQERVREETSRLAAINQRLQAEMATRVETERKLLESQERLELSLWAAQLGLWDWRIRPNRLDVDSRAALLLGMTLAEPISMDLWRARIHPEDKADFEGKLDKHLRGHSEFFEINHRLHQGDGKYRWCHAHGRGTDHDSTGAPRRLVGTLQDVSERKDLENELLQSQKMEAIGRLAGGVAHDFNNLLTAINGYSDLVLRTLDVDSTQRPRIEEIRRAGQRAAVLTNRLLSFGRKQIQQPEALSLSSVLRELKPLLIPAVGEEIELLLVLDQVPLVRADLHQIEQAILNLVVNARDAMPEGGQITLATKVSMVTPPTESGPARPHVQITVADQGHGIEADIREHIFEPFFTTKARGDGSGLGLSMVYGIVKQSEGFVEVSSERGVGTSFHLFFPVVDEASASHTGEFDLFSSEPTEGSGALLVVEDETSVRELLQDALSGLGYQVEAVASGEAALELVSSGFDPDLLLTDIVLGGLNGVELARMLRESRPTLRVLFVSGYAENALGSQLSLGKGMTFVRKPFRMDKLYESIKTLLDSGGRGSRQPKAKK